jgi:hypothetical protein
MHLNRHHPYPPDDPLRAARAQADHWTLQIDRLKSALPARVVGAAEANGDAEAAVSAESAGPAEEPVDAAPPLSPGPSTAAVAASTSPTAAVDDGEAALREAAARSERWTAEVDQYKAALTSPLAADMGTGPPAESAGPAEQAGGTAPAMPPTLVFRGTPDAIAPGTPSLRAAADDADPGIGASVDSPGLAPEPQVLVDGDESANSALRAVEPSTAGADENAANANNAGGDGQESASLLTEANQQLELIRQTLEKILAKPGSVVLD